MAYAFDRINKYLNKKNKDEEPELFKSSTSGGPAVSKPQDKQTESFRTTTSESLRQPTDGVRPATVSRFDKPKAPLKGQRFSRQAATKQALEAIKPKAELPGFIGTAKASSKERKELIKGAAEKYKTDTEARTKELDLDKDTIKSAVSGDAPSYKKITDVLSKSPQDELPEPELPPLPKVNLPQGAFSREGIRSMLKAGKRRYTPGLERFDLDLLYSMPGFESNVRTLSQDQGQLREELKRLVTDYKDDLEGEYQRKIGEAQEKIKKLLLEEEAELNAEQVEEANRLNEELAKLRKRGVAGALETADKEGLNWVTKLIRDIMVYETNNQRDGTDGAFGHKGTPWSGGRIINEDDDNIITIDRTKLNPVAGATSGTYFKGNRGLYGRNLTSGRYFRHGIGYKDWRAKEAPNSPEGYIAFTSAKDMDNMQFSDLMHAISAEDPALANKLRKIFEGKTPTDELTENEIISLRSHPLLNEMIKMSVKGPEGSETELGFDERAFGEDVVDAEEAAQFNRIQQLLGRDKTIETGKFSDFMTRLTDYGGIIEAKNLAKLKPELLNSLYTKMNERGQQWEGSEFGKWHNPIMNPTNLPRPGDYSEWLAVGQDNMRKYTGKEYRHISAQNPFVNKSRVGNGFDYSMEKEALITSLQKHLETLTAEGDTELAKNHLQQMRDSLGFAFNVAAMFGSFQDENGDTHGDMGGELIYNNKFKKPMEELGATQAMMMEGTLTKLIGALKHIDGYDFKRGRHSGQSGSWDNEWLEIIHEMDVNYLHDPTPENIKRFVEEQVTNKGTGPTWSGGGNTDKGNRVQKVIKTIFNMLSNNAVVSLYVDSFGLDQDIAREQYTGTRGGKSRMGWGETDEYSGQKGHIPQWGGGAMEILKTPPRLGMISGYDSSGHSNLAYDLFGLHNFTGSFVDGGSNVNMANSRDADVYNSIAADLSQSKKGMGLFDSMFVPGMGEPGTKDTWNVAFLDSLNTAHTLTAGRRGIHVGPGHGRKNASDWEHKDSWGSDAQIRPSAAGSTRYAPSLASKIMGNIIFKNKSGISW